ncbi:hypothetical protein BDK51DRAFT_38703 [Blyttiomyces helicus]|uniref:Uncharacterized protein n=1 Tax=Blyttiomyces helicus TaxID=388810 RepID=A0A4P9W7R8_9FUNG|nr:hypothetical protein BDK51DRAFT_38703 [Blyttiomyces helicus]|eukprot:RKO87443.1 hypothetical protein BDK51DRAFT_38703 [Blyttiomyces helicus]
MAPDDWQVPAMRETALPVDEEVLVNLAVFVTNLLHQDTAATKHKDNLVRLVNQSSDRKDLYSSEEHLLGWPCDAAGEHVLGPGRSAPHRLPRALQHIRVSMIEERAAKPSPGDARSSATLLLPKPRGPREETRPGVEGEDIHLLLVQQRHWSDGMAAPIASSPVGKFCCSDSEGSQASQSTTEKSGGVCQFHEAAPLGSSRPQGQEPIVAHFATANGARPVLSSTEFAYSFLCPQGKDIFEFGQGEVINVTYDPRSACTPLFASPGCCPPSLRIVVVVVVVLHLLLLLLLLFLLLCFFILLVLLVITLLSTVLKIPLLRRSSSRTSSSSFSAGVPYSSAAIPSNSTPAGGVDDKRLPRFMGNRLSPLQTYVALRGHAMPFQVSDDVPLATAGVL